MFQVYVCEYVFCEDKQYYDIVSSICIGEYNSFEEAWSAAQNSQKEGVIEKDGQHIACF